METPIPGSKQALCVCRGASHTFARYAVTLSQPIPPGLPFIWNREYDGILTLSPFVIYGRARLEGKKEAKGDARIQGLMLINGVPKGKPEYSSIDAEAHFSLDAFVFPAQDDLRAQVGSALLRGAESPRRVQTCLA